WDAATGREGLGLRGHTDNCSCVVFSPDGWRLVSASDDETIRVWDATPLRGDEGEEVFTFTGPDDAVRSVAVSADGGRSVSAGHGMPVKVCNAATVGVGFDFHGHPAPVFSVAWHPDNRHIATAGSDGQRRVVKVWNASDGQVQFEISVGGDPSA